MRTRTSLISSAHPLPCSLPPPHPHPKTIAHKVVVFSKTYCPYASRAKQTLQSEGAVFHIVELDQRNDGGEIQAALGDLTGRRTVPNVFFQGKSIGGGDDTVALAGSGELRKMLSAVGALK
jgi:glutaredoxin 3